MIKSLHFSWILTLQLLDSHLIDILDIHALQSLVFIYLLECNVITILLLLVLHNKCSEIHRFFWFLYLLSEILCLGFSTIGILIEAILWDIFCLFGFFYNFVCALMVLGNAHLLFIFINFGFSCIQIFQVTFCKIVWELLLFNIRNGVDVLEFSLSVPILIEQIVIASELLSYLADKMQILLCHESGNENVTVLLIEHLNPNEPLSGHDSFHEPEIKAPNHNDTQNDCKWCHDDPVLNIIDAENGGIDAIINSITILIITTINIIRMILLEERV